MNRTIQMMVLAAALCAGCESTSSNPGGSLSELVMRGGLVYLKGDTAPYTGVNTMTDPDTGRKMVLSFKNGRKHGQFEEWFNLTQRRAVAQWQDGKIISGTTWKIDGTEGSRVVNGTGTLILFRTNGTRESEKSYRNGVQVPGPSGGSAPPTPTPQPVKQASGLYHNPSTNRKRI